MPNNKVENLSKDILKMAQSATSRTLFRFVVPQWAKILNNIPSVFVKLASTPTTIEKWLLPQVDNDFQLSIKRDDQTSNLSGGNKIRKLEFLMADAIHQKATCVITCGGLQSNHCRATAVIAKELGLQCHLLLRSRNLKEDAEAASTGNLLLNRLHDANCYTVPYESLSGGLNARVDKLAAELKRNGKKPYIIPLGGSNNLGSFGIIKLFQELIEQGLFDNFDDIVVPTGSGGTLAGLSLASYLTGEKVKVHGICVSDDANYFWNFIQEHLLQYGIKNIKANQICDVIEGYKTPAYSKTTNEDLDELISISQQSGILLDYTYTFKAVKGMLSEIKTNPQRFKGNRILFIHTGGIFSTFDGKVGNALNRHRPVYVWEHIKDSPLNLSEISKCR